MQHLSAPELAQWLADDARAKPMLLDVREPWEYQTCHLDGATPMPMRTVPARLGELDMAQVLTTLRRAGDRPTPVRSST